MEDLQSKFSNFENVDNAQVWMQTSQAINMAKQYNNKPRILLTAFLLSYFGEDIMDAEIEQDHNLIIIAQAFTRDPVNNEKFTYFQESLAAWKQQDLPMLAGYVHSMGMLVAGMDDIPEDDIRWQNIREAVNMLNELPANHDQPL